MTNSDSSTIYSLYFSDTFDYAAGALSDLSSDWPIATSWGTRSFVCTGSGGLVESPLSGFSSNKYNYTFASNTITASIDWTLAFPVSLGVYTWAEIILSGGTIWGGGRIRAYVIRYSEEGGVSPVWLWFVSTISSPYTWSESVQILDGGAVDTGTLSISVGPSGSTASSNGETLTGLSVPVSGCYLAMRGDNYNESDSKVVVSSIVISQG